jgi:hypothetical protein
LQVALADRQLPGATFSCEVLLKKILLTVFVVVLAFVWVNRQRVYVRDPLATVYKNDVEQSGVQVYINYSNDVLMELDAGSGGYRTMVQNWNKVPGTPLVLKCIRWTACMTDADYAVTSPLAWNGKGKYDPQVAMSGREVSFVDADGAKVRVVLR